MANLKASGTDAPDSSKPSAPSAEPEPEQPKPESVAELKTQSTFKPRVTGDKFEDFEGSFPFFMYNVLELFEQIQQARDPQYGGVDLHCTTKSLIMAFSDKKEDYDRFESLVDEL